MRNSSQPLLWPHSAVILAGGLSSRMKQPKEGVLLSDGQPFLTHLLQTLKVICSQIIVVGECKGFNLASEPSVIHLHDQIGGKGPLSGIHAVLASQLDSCYLVVTCDQPLLTTPLLSQLTKQASHYKATVYSFDDNHVEPFPGCYPAQLFPLIEEAIEKHDYSLTRLLERTPAAINKIKLDIGSLPFIQSINTPEDLIRANKLYTEVFSEHDKVLEI